jgi:HSP20 family protein
MESLTRSPRRTSPLRSLQDEVNRLFESVFPGQMSESDEPTSTVWSPRMDLMETDDHYRMRVDLPGISKDDVSVTVEDNRLTVRGERRDESRTEKENVVRMERTFGTFYRSLRLPKSVNESKIKATFTDGVLSVEIPKTEKSKPKKIKIS